jgi:hypothetical protein
MVSFAALTFKGVPLTFDKCTTIDAGSSASGADPYSYNVYWTLNLAATPQTVSIAVRKQIVYPASTRSTRYPTPSPLAPLPLAPTGLT